MITWEPPETYVTIKYEVDGISEWVWRKGDVFGLKYPSKDWSAIRDATLMHTPGRDLIIQAGGCCGMYPRLWSKYFKTVHTFEPVSANFEALCKNCPSPNIHKHAAALGDSNQFVRMMGGKERDGITDQPIKNVGMYWVQGVFDSGVYQVKIDDLKLDKLDAIQLDVERYEINVLRGAVESIKKFWPTICIETFEDESADLLRPLGYKVVARAARDYVLTRV